MKNEPKNRKSMIKVRGCFSESIGMKICNTQMQVADFDERTRTIISNTLFDVLAFFLDNPSQNGYRNACDCDYYNDDAAGNSFCKSILSDVFNQSTLLGKGYYFKWRSVYEQIDDVILGANYNEVLDLLWYINSWIEKNFIYHLDSLPIKFNILFEQEYVGYRFVNNRIVAITDKSEISEIETACNNPFDGCKSHIQKAVTILSDREHKDYKNCIKESISAVESICKIITNNSKATLGQSLKELKENGITIHPALESAFSKLYGYTSDEGGIRHCEGMFESNVTFEEAKFMLVSCAAFVNYLIAEYGKIKGN